MGVGQAERRSRGPWAHQTAHLTPHPDPASSTPVPPTKSGLLERSEESLWTSKLGCRDGQTITLTEQTLCLATSLQPKPL